MVNVSQEEIKDFYVTRIVNAFKSVSEKYEKENPGLAFKGIKYENEGYMWIIGCYKKEKIVLTPEVLQREIVNKTRELKDAMNEIAKTDDQKEIFRLSLQKELKKLRKWKRECRKGIYRVDSRDICAAYTVYFLMSPDIVEPIICDVVSAVNEQRDKNAENREKILNNEEYKIIDLEGDAGERER